MSSATQPPVKITSAILSDATVSSNAMNETRRMSNVLPILSIRYNKDMKTYTKTELVEGN